MRNLRVPVVFALALGLVAGACGGGPGTAPSTSPGATGTVVSSDPFVLLSTQLNTVTESEALRTQILSGFTAAKVEFRGEAAGPFADRIVAESKTKGSVGVVGGLHGDFGALDLNLFEDLTPLAEKAEARATDPRAAAIIGSGPHRKYASPSGSRRSNVAASRRPTNAFDPGESPSSTPRTNANRSLWSASSAVRKMIASGRRLP